MSSVVAYVALGSNLGQRRASLDGALLALANTGQIEIERRSPWFETEAVGGPAGQGPYLNGVVELVTTLGPRELLDRLLEIEQDFGRRRDPRERNSPRTLDLDLLLFHLCSPS